jgi:hypothetical protein
VICLVLRVRRNLKKQKKVNLEAPTKPNKWACPIFLNLKGSVSEGKNISKDRQSLGLRDSTFLIMFLFKWFSANEMIMYN